MITNNTLFFKTVTALKEMPCGEFSKKQYEKVLNQHLCGGFYPLASTLFEHLRMMNFVVLKREEDLSVITDQWGDEMNITKAQYDALPLCVQSALDWKVCPRVRNWYVVNHLAIAQEIANRKMALSKDFDLLNSL